MTGLGLGLGIGAQGKGGTPTPTPVATALWTPANAPAGTFALFWDFTDPASLSLTSGAINSVTDKTGNGNTLTGSGATRPVMVSSLSSTYGQAHHDVAYFQGASAQYVLSTPSPVVQANPAVLYASIIAQPGAASAYQTVFDSNTQWLFRSRNNAPPIGYAGSVLSLPGDLPDGFPTTVRMRDDGAGTGYLSTDAGSETSGAIGSNSINGTVRVGDSAADDARYCGYINQLLPTTANVTPNSTLDYQIQGYMAWHNGSFKSLPSAHPYRYAAPKPGMTATPPTISVPSGTWIPAGTYGAWHASNICDFKVVPYPADASKLLMFATGQASPAGSGYTKIGIFTISATDPVNNAPVFIGTIDKIASSWDDQGDGIRLGSVLWVGSRLYIYYSPQTSGDYARQIGVMWSDDAATNISTATWTRQGAALLTYSGDEVAVSEAEVVHSGGTFYMTYSFRTDLVDQQQFLPGFRLATSSSPNSGFSKQSGQTLMRPTYTELLEDKQIIQYRDRWKLIGECGGISSNPYFIYMADGPGPGGPWEFEKYVLQPSQLSGTGTSILQIATGFVLQTNGQTFLIYQGGSDHLYPPQTNVWSGYILTITGGLFD